jgi:hypothetical protein
VTLQDIATIGDYELVYIGAHGLYTQWKYHENWFGYESMKASLIYLEQKADWYWSDVYRNELVNHHLGISNGCYSILPGFISARYESSDLKDTLVYVGSCELMGKDGDVNEDWAHAFKNAGAPAFVGYHNSNYIEYNFLVFQKFAHGLFMGDTAQTALASALDLYGEDHSVWYKEVVGSNSPFIAAYPLLRGDQNARLQGYETIVDFPAEDPSAGDAPIQVEMKEVHRKEDYAEDGTLLNVVSMEIPVISGGKPGVAEKINAVFAASAADGLEDPLARWDNDIDGLPSDIGRGMPPLTNSMTYEVSYQDGLTISFQSSRVWYGEGPHGEVLEGGYTFSLLSGEQLFIDDVLNVDASNVTETLMREFYEQRPYAKGGKDDGIRMQSGLDAKFSLTNDGVLIYYGQYTFTYADSYQNIIIPWTRTDLIKLQRE